MKVGDKHYRSIWWDSETNEVKIIDQRWLPHEFRIVSLKTLDDFATAIKDMWVRGAPLIGATAAYAMAEIIKHDPSDASLENAYDRLHATRPTAVNLRWALDYMKKTLSSLPEEKRSEIAFQKAAEICDDDVETNRMIGVHGLELIKKIQSQKKPGETVNILTHCNAGWLATVDWGTATSPMYHAMDAGIPIHVWVDETRPRNQGAQLTCWEMVGNGVLHHLVVDNAGGHLMQHGQVDMVIVGTDRTSAQGDVCNKIGTYLKALAAKDNNIPFYVALPSSTIDWTIKDGFTEIPIEERDGYEVTHIYGKADDGQNMFVQISPDETPGGNPAFDVTPAHLVTGLITERGVAEASEEGLLALFPERRSVA